MSLCANSALVKALPWEDQAELDAFSESVYQHYQPATAYEQMLARLVVWTTWRYRRLLRVEESMLADCAPSPNPSVAISSLTAVIVDDESSKSLKFVMRTVAAARREANTAVAHLQRAQHERIARHAVSGQEDARLTVAIPSPQPHLQSTPDPTTSSPVQPRTVSGQRVPGLSRTERRALERKLRKAEKKATRQAAPNEIGFVSHMAA
jgi:hypothetical protein